MQYIFSFSIPCGEWLKAIDGRLSMVDSSYRWKIIRRKCATLVTFHINYHQCGKLMNANKELKNHILFKNPEELLADEWDRCQSKKNRVK